MYGERWYDPDEVPAHLRDCFEEVSSECGAPWKRVVETHRNGVDWNKNNRAGGDRLVVGQSASDAMPRDYRAPSFLGWSPTCPHADAPIVPATVLDCFSGSGTTLMVADRLGRDAIGIDLQDSYVFMSERRVVGDAPLFTTIDTLRQADFLEPDGAEG